MKKKIKNRYKRILRFSARPIRKRFRPRTEVFILRSCRSRIIIYYTQKSDEIHVM